MNEDRLTPTQRMYRTINFSQEACRRLRNTSETKEDFTCTVKNLVKQLDTTDDEHIYINSLISNLWRFGAWHNLKKAAPRTKTPPAPSPAHSMERTTADTERVTDDIDNCPEFQQRLRAESFTKSAFNRCICEILNEIHAPAVYKNVLMNKLWTGGKWKTSQHNSAEFGPDCDISMKPGENYYNKCYATTHKYETAIDTMMASKEHFPRINTSTGRLIGAKDMTVEIKHQTLINECPVDQMSDSDIIHHIGNTEATIEKREKLKTKSKHITADIEAMKATCAQLAEILDNRADDS